MPVGAGPLCMNGFLHRLRTRRVVQWGLAYLAGAWVTLQVMDVLGELFGWSLPLQRTLFALLVVGFFAAVVVAWFHGEHGQQRVSALEGVLLAGLFGVAGLTAALTSPWRVDPDPDAAGSAAAGLPLPGLPAAAGDDRPSVAVLPFRDLGSAADRTYFADGVHEEIIAQLTRIRGLKVISRTSTMGYRETDRTVGQIAAELGVGAILEGSVRHAGDSVRITATLVDARRDEPVWSESYDRATEEIFAIQEDVARAVVRGLSASLTPEESRRLSRPLAESVTAYELHLLSRHQFRRFGPEGLARALELAERALEEDSTFASAWMMVGRASMVMALGHAGVGDSPEDEMERARAALRQALRLDPGLAEARAALALILGTWDYDLDGALLESRAAVESAPGDAIAAEIHGMLLSTVGRDEEAIASVRRAVGLDPLAPVIASNLGWIYLNARRFEEALEQARRALELESDFHDALTLVGRTSIRIGRFAEAVEAYRRGAEVSGDNPEDLGGLAHALARAGDREGAREVLGRLLERSRREFVPPLHVGYAYLGLGDDERALEWFARGVDERGGWTVWLPRYPEAAHLHGDPRFRGLVDRMGLVRLIAPPP